jgi:LacI family transcriptional regulator
MAMGAYDSIREHGLSVPADISVVGYDNQEIIAAFVRPPLTTVALPFEEMGSTGVALLASLAEGGGGAQQLEIKGPLIERDSVRPLRR